MSAAADLATLIAMADTDEVVRLRLLHAIRDLGRLSLSAVHPTSTGVKRGVRPDRDRLARRRTAGQTVGAEGLEPPTFAL